MVLSSYNTLQCNLPNGLAGNSEMTEPATEDNSLIVGDLFSKNPTSFEKIASVFLFVIEIVIVTEFNTKPRISAHGRNSTRKVCQYLIFPSSKKEVVNYQKRGY